MAKKQGKTKKFNADAYLKTLTEKVKQAQLEFSTYPQERVDKIFAASATAANHARIELAKEAVAETGMGIVEDKVIKNHYAAEYIYNTYHNVKTCGVIEHDVVQGISKIAESIGVIAAVIPTTNPTSTAIFKALLALKTRNAIIFSPHPRAKHCTVHAAQIVLEAAVRAGAPKNIIGWIEDPTIELTQKLMTHDNVSLILATGGPDMVKAAYSSGKPAIGVGSGNTPVVIDETADIPMAVSSILLSKTFDNGVVCASEQGLFVVKSVYNAFKKELARQGGYILTPEQAKKLSKILLAEDGRRVSPKIVGQPAVHIAAMAGIKVPKTAKILTAEVSKVGPDEPFSFEKLSTVLALYKVADFKAGVAKAKEMIEFGGLGHTGVIYTNETNQDRIAYFRDHIKAGRIIVNCPASHGAIGDIYNFRLIPSLTLGTGTHGGNIVSENVGAQHLLNIKTVAERRENMLWFRVPPKIYFKRACLSLALRELKGRKKAFIVTDHVLFDLGYTKPITDVLEDIGIKYEIFNEVKPDPDLTTIRNGVKLLNAFQPDVIISIGGGSPIDASKIMWLMYEQPETNFKDISMRFMDIRKRIVRTAEEKKCMLVAIPTTSGTGSEVTPFAVITDDREGVKYPIADYILTPDMAIVDPDLVMNMPKGLTAAGGIDAVTHSIEAIVAITATDYTTPIAMDALKLLFEYLPAAYKEGAKNPEAREKVHYAASMAGMAFANAFLGLCHSMAHKLGSAFHIAHGVANSILLPYIIRFNATEAPWKFGTFPQYRVPEAVERYGKIADMLGLGGTSPRSKVEKLIAAVIKLEKDLELPMSIKEAGIKEKEFLAKVDELSELAFDDQCTGANPRYPLIEEIKEIYLQAYYGK